MRILFLMLQLPEEHKGGGMYVDLAEQFKKNNHEVTIMAPDNNHARTYICQERGMRVLRVNSKATQGVANMIQKGFALAMLPRYYKKAFDHHLSSEKFDWIIMPTPPITLSGFVDYVKKRTDAKFYLILRDIHPQSVWSIGLLHNRLEYYFLDRKARMGYDSADLIGCMSQGNIDFIAREYPYLNQKKLVILYNWLKSNGGLSKAYEVRQKFGLQDKYVVLFGGTIGKGQRIENIVFLANYYLNNNNIAFVIIGKGVEKERLELIAKKKNLTNILFIDFMPQEDYLHFVSSVDLGLITINEHYAVPTCPSKAISYMSLGIPIFAMINPQSDYGQWIEDAGAGYWTVGADSERTIKLFDKLYTDADLRKRMGQQGRNYYLENCTEVKAYETMIRQMYNIGK